MDGAMGAAAGLGMIGYAVVAIMLMIAPLGIWAAVGRTNKLLLEQNMRLYQLVSASSALVELPCRSCAAKGRMEQMEATPGGGYRCPRCNGTRK
jgi:hypothetical protein